jgi:hypothetical protein
MNVLVMLADDPLLGAAFAITFLLLGAEACIVWRALRTSGTHALSHRRGKR